MKKILFAGLGRMGLPMAKNLLKSSHQIFGYDISLENLERASDLGIIPYTQNKENQYDIYLTMVPDYNSVLEFYTSYQGPFQNTFKPSLLIDCSTIGPTNALKIYDKAKSKNLKFVDAPVSGGVVGAQNGTLTFMVGAENEQIFQEAKNYLQFMGANIMNCEKPGMGQTAKICNNLALAIQMRSIVEAMNLGANLGMNPANLVKILSTCTSSCWSLTKSNPMPGVDQNSPASRNYDNGFSCALIKKDLELAIKNAQTSNSSVEFAKLCQQTYKELCDEGLGEKDFGIVFQKIVKNKQLITTSFFFHFFPQRYVALFFFFIFLIYFFSQVVKRLVYIYIVFSTGQKMFYIVCLRKFSNFFSTHNH